MASAMNWEKARMRRREREPKKRKRKTIAVHPNSMAARKLGRTTWTTDA